MPGCAPLQRPGASTLVTLLTHAFEAGTRRGCNYAPMNATFNRVPPLRIWAPDGRTIADGPKRHRARSSMIDTGASAAWETVNG